MDIRHHITEGRQANGLTVIFGMEYDTPDGDFLIYGPYEYIDKKMGAADLLNYVHATKGIAIAAHPFRKDRPVKEVFFQNGLCPMIESINGRNSDIENLRADRWAKRYALTESGGSDAHILDELGRVVTRFSMPILSRKDLIHAMNHSLCKPEWRTHHKMALSY